jgi:hypothetical protein
MITIQFEILGWERDPWNLNLNQTNHATCAKEWNVDCAEPKFVDKTSWISTLQTNIVVVDSDVKTIFFADFKILDWVIFTLKEN